MKLINIKNCPGTLDDGYSTYSPRCLKNVFYGKKVSHVLPYSAPKKSEEVNELFIENRKRISFSGAQDKLSLILKKNQLQLTQESEVGNYILKPIPRDLKKVDQVPANEHLTMQIAKHVYGIHTAENALIFFKSGEPAYITKRFDIKKDGARWASEDFATLAGKNNNNSGPDFKYLSSYEEIGLLIQKYILSWRIEIEKYFNIVLFNYLFSNGDAHLKNFSILESENGDYFLSPAYDLLNTRLHVDDTVFALNKGLFADEFKSLKYRSTGYPNISDFVEFARRISVDQIRIEVLLKSFLSKQKEVEELTKRSYLNDSCKRGYLMMYNSRINKLNS